MSNNEELREQRASEQKVAFEASQRARALEVAATVLRFLEVDEAFQVAIDSDRLRDALYHKGVTRLAEEFAAAQDVVSQHARTERGISDIASSHSAEITGQILNSRT